MPDESLSPAATRHTARSPWRRSSEDTEDKPDGAVAPSSPQGDSKAEDPRTTVTPPSASNDDGPERVNPLFGGGLRRVSPKPGTDEAASAAPQPASTPNRGGFKLGRAFEEQVTKAADDATSEPREKPSNPDMPAKRSLDQDDGLSAPRKSPRAAPAADAAESAPRRVTRAIDDEAGIATPRRMPTPGVDDAVEMPRRAPRASEESAMMPPRAPRTSLNGEDVPRASSAVRPPRGGLKLPESVRSAAAQSLNPDDSNAGLKASRAEGDKENKFPFHRRFTKAGWVAIIVSQLLLATGLVVGVRRYFGVGQAEAPAAPPSPIVKATQTAAASKAQAQPPVVTKADEKPTASAPTAAPAATAVSAPTSAPADPVPAAGSAGGAGGDFEARPVNSKPGPMPFFGPSYRADDGKPVYVCAAQPDGSSLALLHMQMAGLDVANGFHLGIVPLGFDDNFYGVAMSEHAKALNTKTWDCLFANVDEAAQRDLGVITAIVDENVGGYGIWSRAGLRSFEDLRDRKLGYVRDASSQYFAGYVLGIMTQDVRDSVQLQAYDTMGAALDAFNGGQVDAVSLPDSFLRLRAVRGARPVVDSAQLRVIVGSIVTSRASIADRADLVKRFHSAYFQTLAQQAEDVDASASRIANWGNPSWSGVNRGNAAADLRQMLTLSAQATGEQNVALARDNAPIKSVLNASRDLYTRELSRSGAPAQSLRPLADVIDLSYASEAGAAVTSTARPLNASFSLRAATADAGATPLPAAGASETVAVLPCRKFTFEPDSARLTDESRRVLDLCVAPALRQRDGLFLLVRGSAAWPGPRGTYTEAQIREIANSRAKAITEYLISQQINPARFKIESVVPPAERRDTDDPIEQAEDRWVKMSLIASGR
jgi:ABC-type amino acid transport substrate-binding protein